MEENRTKSYNRKQKSVDSEVRKFVNPIKPLMSEEDASRNQGSHGSTEPRTFGGTLKPLMSEAEKAEEVTRDSTMSWLIPILV